MVATSGIEQNPEGVSTDSGVSLKNTEDRVQLK